MFKVLFLIMGMSSIANAAGGNCREGLQTCGTSSSGGGMGVVCYDSTGKNVESVELLDLWEARKLYGRTINSSQLSVEDLVINQLHNLKHSIDSEGLVVGTPNGDLLGPEALFGHFEWITSTFLHDGELANMKRLRGVELTLTDDAYEVIKPIDCEIKQLVRYTDTALGGQILINQDLLDKMDNVNLAALYLHEAFYTYLRKHKEKSSIRVRRTIGLAMSGFEFKTWDSFLPDEYVKCTGRHNKAFIYEIPPYGYTYTISMVAGRKMIGFDPRGAIWGGDLEDVFTEQGNSSWGVLGSVIGNDFSYKIKVAEDPVLVNEFPWSASLTLLSSPDQEGASSEVSVGCERVFK